MREWMLVVEGSTYISVLLTSKCQAGIRHAGRMTGIANHFV